MTSAAPNWLESCLSNIPPARVAVFGDFCLDAYWILDTSETELSIETGLPVRYVRRQRYSLGGAGNVVANLVDLGVQSVEAVGVVGEDLFGSEMLKHLRDKRVRSSGMIVSPQWQTLVYSKPILGDDELNRIDFGAFNELTPPMLRTLEVALDEAATRSEIVVLNQQLPGGVSTPAMIERINAVLARHPRCRFIVDARHRGHLYRGAMLKMNAHEAAAAIGERYALDQKITGPNACRIAQSLQQRTGQPVFITRGEAGMIVADHRGVHEEPGVLVTGATDPVGAGDTAISALAAAMGSGIDAPTAARLANLAASVTVRKLKTTGTATPQELRSLGPAPDRLYHVDLADNIALASYAPQSRVEVVRTPPQRTEIRCAIFDHDGTITTLRQGWEAIMEPVMVRAICGARSPDNDAMQRITRRVRQLIDHTTGVQTLVQMQGLVELVHEFGLVAAHDIHDEHTYKARYKRDLDRIVQQRLEQLKAGERMLNSVLVPGVREMLSALRGAGVRLYLCSGSDREDVVADAEMLGISDYFEGRIYGAVGDVTVEAKRMTLDQIMGEIGAGSEGEPEGGLGVVTFGDGPVEMRETRKRGGIAVGLATDETNLGELSTAKRRRLIRAGADIVIADYREVDAVLALIGVDTAGKPAR